MATQRMSAMAQLRSRPQASRESFVDSYQLSKINTNSSSNSAISAAEQRKVSLQLNPREIASVRHTWNKMLSETNGAETDRLAVLALSTFCSQLYINLLEMDPLLEVAFPSLRHQAALMAGLILSAVNLLENLSEMDDYLVGLGKRHSRILGIEPPQFELMGEALIQTFHERFGTRFTHELEVLWIKLYMYLANSLIQFGVDPVLKLERLILHESVSTIALLTETSHTVVSEKVEEKDKKKRKRKLTRRDCVIV